MYEPTSAHSCSWCFLLVISAAFSWRLESRRQDGITTGLLLQQELLLLEETVSSAAIILLTSHGPLTALYCWYRGTSK